MKLTPFLCAGLLTVVGGTALAEPRWNPRPERYSGTMVIYNDSTDTFGPGTVELGQIQAMRDQIQELQQKLQEQDRVLGDARSRQGESNGNASKLASRLDEQERTIDSLKRTVEEQQRTLDALKRGR